MDDTRPDLDPTDAPPEGGCTYRVEGVPGHASVRVVERRASAAGAVTSWLIV